MFSGDIKKFLRVGLVLIIVGYVFYNLKIVGYSRGYTPSQPIPFSHKLHAGQNNIPCLYCHANAERSKHATVPAMNICFNCHSVVKVDSPWIKKLKEAFDKGEPVQWVKVHDLPDFVHFSHKRHVAKDIACETCHGDVKNMDVIRQDQPMTMGWCLDCHRGVTAPEHLYQPKYHDFGLPSSDGGLGHTRPGALVAQDGNEANIPHATNAPGTPVAPTSCYTCHH